MATKREKGRPPTRGVPMKTVQTLLQPVHIEIARQMGNGQVSAGLRAMVEAYVAEHGLTAEQVSEGRSHGAV